MFKTKKTLFQPPRIKQTIGAVGRQSSPSKQFIGAIGSKTPTGATDRQIPRSKQLIGAIGSKTPTGPVESTHTTGANESKHSTGAAELNAGGGDRKRFTLKEPLPLNSKQKLELTADTDDISSIGSEGSQGSEISDDIGSKPAWLVKILKSRKSRQDHSMSSELSSSQESCQDSVNSENEVSSQGSLGSKKQESRVVSHLRVDSGSTMESQNLLATSSPEENLGFPSQSGGFKRSKSQTSLLSQSSNWSGFLGLSASQPTPALGSAFLHQDENQSVDGSENSQSVLDTQSSQEIGSFKLMKRSVSQSRSVSGSLNKLKMKRSKSCASLEKESLVPNRKKCVLPQPKIPSLNHIRTLAKAARSATSRKVSEKDVEKNTPVSSQCLENSLLESGSNIFQDSNQIENDRSLVLGDMINLENTPRTEPQEPALPPTTTKMNIIIKPRNSEVINSFDSLSFQERDSVTTNPKTAAPDSETEPESAEQSTDLKSLQKDSEDTNKTAMELPSKILNGKPEAENEKAENSGKGDHNMDDKDRSNEKSGGIIEKDGGDNNKVGGDDKKVGGEKKNGGDNKKVDGDNEKIGGDNEKVGGDNKKKSGGNKKVGGDNKKVGGDNKKNSGDNKKVGGDNKKNSGDNKKTGGYNKKVGGDNKKDGGDNNKVGGDKKNGDDKKKDGGDKNKIPLAEKKPRGRKPDQKTGINSSQGTQGSEKLEKESKKKNTQTSQLSSKPASDISRPSSSQTRISNVPTRNSSKTRDDLLDLQKRREGMMTWVLCDDKNCGKWRRIQEQDPTALPRVWYCRNNPDEKYNRCDIPEEECDPKLESLWVETRYTAGSLVWAKTPGWPAWPGMVDDDPDTGDFFWTVGNKISYEVQPVSYHVVFFDSRRQPISRSWIQTQHLSKFSKDNVKVESVTGRAKIAAQIGLEALELDILERRKKYCFANRFKGPWGPSWLDDIDVEVTATPEPVIEKKQKKEKNPEKTLKPRPSSRSNRDKRDSSEAEIISTEQMRKKGKFSETEASDGAPVKAVEPNPPSTVLTTMKPGPNHDDGIKVVAKKSLVEPVQDMKKRNRALVSSDGSGSDSSAESDQESSSTIKPKKKTRKSKKMKTAGKPMKKISDSGKRDLKINDTPKKRESRSIKINSNEDQIVVSTSNIDETEETKQKNEVEFVQPILMEQMKDVFNKSMYTQEMSNVLNKSKDLSFSYDILTEMNEMNDSKFGETIQGILNHLSEEEEEEEKDGEPSQVLHQLTVPVETSTLEPELGLVPELKETTDRVAENDVIPVSVEILATPSKTSPSANNHLDSDMFRNSNFVPPSMEDQMNSSDLKLTINNMDTDRDSMYDSVLTSTPTQRKLVLGDPSTKMSESPVANTSIPALPLTPIPRFGLAQVGLKPKKCHDQEVPGDEDIQGYGDLDLDLDSDIKLKLGADESKDFSADESLDFEV